MVRAGHGDKTRFRVRVAAVTAGGVGEPISISDLSVAHS